MLHEYSLNIQIMARGFESYERDRNTRTPAKAFNSRLIKGVKPEEFRGSTEGINEARIRATELPNTIQDSVHELMNKFSGTQLDKGVKPKDAWNLIKKIKRFIGDTIPAHVEYATELSILATYEKSLSQN